MLRMTSNLTVQQSSFHQANLVQQVVDGIQNMLHANLQQPPDQLPELEEHCTHQANAVTNNDILPSLVQQMAPMQSMMLQLQTQLQNQQNTCNAQAPSPAPAPAPRQKQIRDKYCWMHGAGTHDGYGCTRPAVGHKKEATFKNKMGGTQKHCKNR